MLKTLRIGPYRPPKNISAGVVIDGGMGALGRKTQ
jgi:hypothetical protein